ncbi:MAG: dienelactone hydrolase family protein [Desulfocapsaceae bacterium]|jgi:dienelactone hydrolase|nr:dienelactone hydrolase family protein [Desulfocapsaceae bacterium]
MRYTLLFLLALLLSTNAYASGKAVTYSVEGGDYEGYYISAKEGAPLLLLIHDWDGLTDYEIKRAEMLADLGYSVFAADLFGKGVRPTEVEDKKQHTGELYQDRAKMRKLLQGAFDEGVRQGGDGSRSVVFGYCFGGAAVLEMARAGSEADAFVTFHGGLSTPEGQDYSKTAGSIFVFHGSADTAITMEDFASLAAQLETAGVDHEMVTYSGAPHAFTVFGSDRYHEVADRKSWQRFTEILDTLLK